MKRLGIVIAVVVLAAGGAAAALYARGRREVTTSSREALRCYRLGKENEQKLYERDAVASYAEALRHDPHFVMATVRLARYLRQRDPDRAKSLIECVSRFRDEITPREELALRIFESQMKGDADKTDALVDEYARKYPSDPEAYQLRADRFARKGKVEQAVAEYQRLLSVNPNYAVAYNSLGYYFAKLGDFGKGEDYLKRYRFLAPDQANPYDSLGELYANVGRYDEAEESLKKALAIKPDFFPSIGHLGTVAVGRGDFGGAAAQFQRAAELVDTPGARIDFEGSAAFFLAAAGRQDEAKSLLARMEADVASTAEVERKLLMKGLRMTEAAAYARLGDAEKTEAFLKEAEAAAAASHSPEYDKGKDDAEFGRSLAAIRGLLAHTRGDYETSVASLQKAVTVTENPMGGFPYVPYQHLIRVALAESLRQLGHQEEAEGTLKAVLARNPHFQPAVAEMARLKEAPSEAVPRRS